MGLPQPKRLYTSAEYYALEQAASYKSDYYRGEIFAMAGGSPRHSLIAGNIIREMGNALKRSPCHVYESNLRIKSKLTGLRNYPDASVFCEPLEIDADDPQQQTATNPSILFEVLSPTTEGYDRGIKAESYRRIDSLKAYVIVSQDRPHVEIYERQTDRSWSLREEGGMDASLAITPVGVNLPLAEIYAGVKFDEVAENSQGI